MGRSGGEAAGEEAETGLPPMGAHVSVAGGLPRAVERGREIGATALQIFTKQPRRWAEPQRDDDEIEAFREAIAAAPVRVTAAHESYLLNLATEETDLFRKSRAALRAELERCVRLGLDFLVVHPGNATGGDRGAALRRNARAVAGVIEEVPGPTRVLLETTAGSGTALGRSFEELSEMLEAMPPDPAGRVGICLDTAHVFAAGYDLRDAYDDVIDAFDRILGLDRLDLVHVNDSKAPLGSRVDRHAHVGRGEMGEAAFRKLMRDPSLASVPRVLETPKGDDATASDRRNLETLRRLASG